MSDEQKALELAKKIVASKALLFVEPESAGKDLAAVCRALIARCEPVEAQRHSDIMPNFTTGRWDCGKCFESIEHQQRFCHMCGQEVKWKD